MCEQCKQQERESDVRWLALLIRQGLKLIVVGIEKRYDLSRDQDRHSVRKDAA